MKQNISSQLSTELTPSQVSERLQLHGSLSRVPQLEDASLRGNAFPQEILIHLMDLFQVRRGRFGPEWECGDMISIGLWVGILVTLGFALICAWGFSMLASINVSLPQLWGTYNNAALCCRLWTALTTPKGKIFTFHRQQIRTILIHLLSL